MMKYTVKYSTLFKKSFKKCMKRGCSVDKFRKVISILSETGTLPPEYKPHEGASQTYDTPSFLSPIS